MVETGTSLRLLGRLLKEADGILHNQSSQKHARVFGCLQLETSTESGCVVADNKEMDEGLAGKAALLNVLGLCYNAEGVPSLTGRVFRMYSFVSPV